jgi:hypothetical protein
MKNIRDQLLKHDSLVQDLWKAYRVNRNIPTRYVNDGSTGKWEYKIFVVTLKVESIDLWAKVWAERAETIPSLCQSRFPGRARNILRGNDEQLSFDRGSLAPVAIAVATALYGGFHALLWNSHFPYCGRNAALEILLVRHCWLWSICDDLHHLGRPDWTPDWTAD